LATSASAAGSQDPADAADATALAPARPRPLGPVAPLGFLVVAAWVALAWLNGGYPATRWGPIGIGLCLGLWLALALLPVRLGDLGKARIVACASLAAFALLAYLSILWAVAPGDAWTGADRGLIAVASFLVLALWPWSKRGVTAILVAFVLAVVGSAVVELFRVAFASDPAGLFEDGRLVGPIGYVNGTVAFWMLALWPAVHLGSTQAGPRWLRPLALAGASLFLDLSVFGESRAWLPALGLSAVLALALARQRMRWLIGFAIAGSGTLVAQPFLVDVFERSDDVRDFASLIDRAVVAMVATSAAVALAGVAWVALDNRVTLRPNQHRVLAIAVAGLVAACVIASAAVGLAKVGNPASFAREKWDDFAHSYSFTEEGSRFGGSLSGQRYEEWRIAWGQFLDHPVLGAGADNFAAAYLAEREDNFHEPRHPHSLPLRLLSQTGVVGALLFVVGLGAAGFAALRNRTRLDPLVGGSLAACVAACAYWLVQGAVDVLWEIPAVAGPALGLLGLAASRLYAQSEPASASGPGRPSLSARSLARAAATALVLGGASVMLALPWLSSLYANSGARVWRADPQLAYDRLERAADLAPLSAEPLVIEGSIALRRGELEHARAVFARALERDPTSWYAHLELGLLEGSTGAYPAARRELAASLRLNPNERVTRLAWRLVRERAPVDPTLLNRTFVDPEFRPPGLESYTHEVESPP
jgi:hypothetical protein